jgi:FkbM family methyltransferase
MIVSELKRQLIGGIRKVQLHQKKKKSKHNLKDFFYLKDGKELALQKFFNAEDQKSLLNTDRFISGDVKFKGNKLHYTDNVALLGMLDEIYLNKNYLFRSEKKNPVIIDCGANVGIGVLYIKEIFPESKVIAIEADPLVFNSLEKNVRSFKLSNITCLNNAVWINENELTFQSDNRWGGFVGEDSESINDNNSFKVKGINLNTLITEDIDLLKLDIEGAETDVLLDAKEKIVKHVQNIFFEWHSINGQEQRLGDILSYFAKNGFRYHIREASKKKSPFMEKRENVRMDSQLDCFLYKV